ncbi:hypothetical protein [Mycobacterium sp. 155]|uniref:hypothetical protein n=1 Tax=Mycobacterium sp. 155 TaxID=1157943 RepID=UPI000382EB1E|nr:hypothetical protein [Mycobacterium sp. 155]
MSITKIATAAALLAAAVTLTAGCSTGSAHEHHAAPVSSTAAVAPTLPNLRELSPEVDTVAARGALDHGAPFIFGIPDGPEPACHSAVVDPAGRVWILNRVGAAPATGVALTDTVEEYGCTGVAMPPGTSIPAPAPASAAVHPAGVPDLSRWSTQVDLTAAGRAMKAGQPFMFAMPAGDTAACHSAALLPPGAVWVMNVSGPAPVAGVALSDVTAAYGCRTGMQIPGGTR